MATSAQTLPREGAQWVFRGPAPIELSSAGPSLGGRITALLATPSGILAGTASGGLWQWQAGSWRPLGDQQPSLEISALARDPASGGLFYAGTGDPTLGDGGAGAIGLLASSDGVNWQATAAYLHGLTIHAIWIDANDAAHLIVATTAPSPGATAGLYESNDGGASWALIGSGQATSMAQTYGGGPLIVGIGPDIASWHPGASPALSSPILNAASYVVAANPSAAGAVALALDAQGDCLGIALASDDATWPTSTLPCPETGPFVVPVALAYGASGTLWLAGQHVWKYFDGSWQIAGSGWTAPGQVHALLFAGSNVWAGGDGGVWELPGGNGAWEDENGAPSLAALGAVTLTSAAEGAAGLIGAANAGGLLAAGSGLAWNSVAAPGSATLAVAARDADAVYAAVPAAAGLWVSANGGASYQAAPAWSAGAGPSYAASDATLAPARAPLAVDPSAASHLYWATDRLWQSGDGGRSWSATAPAPAGSVYTAIAIAPQNPNVVYLGTSGGAILDGQGTRLAASGLPAAPVATLAVDPDPSAAAAATAPETVVAGLGGPAGGVYLSTDGGASWAAIGGALPTLPVVAVAMDPVAPQTIYVALRLGVYASPDRGATWYALGTGLANAPLADLRLIGGGEAGTRALLAATAGRGAWTLPLADEAAPLDAVSGGGQTGTAGQPLAQPLVVAASDVFGAPLANAAIRWNDNGAGGTFSSAQSVTDNSGQASTIYTLPAKAGSVSLAAATAGGGTAFFTVTAAAGAVAAVTAEAGGGQTAQAGTPLPQPVAALVADAKGNPVAGVAVAFSDGGAGGSFAPATATSDARGVASAIYKLPSAPGPVTITASVANLPPAKFAETAAPAPDFTLTLDPTQQSADVNSTATFRIAAAAAAGFQGTIQLACLVPATGCSVTPGAISPGQTATVTVPTDNSPGASTFTVQASGGTYTHTISGTVNVLPPDFGVSLAASGGPIDQAAADNFAVTTTAINGAYPLISFSCTAPAQGCTFSPAQVTPGQSATLTIAANSLAAGQQTITVQASDGRNTHTASLAITVTPPGLAVAVATPSASVAAGQAASSNVSITPSGALSGTVSLACAGLPAGASCAFQPASWTSTGSGTGTVTVTVATTAAGAAAPSGGTERWPWLLLALAAPLGAFGRRRRPGNAGFSPAPRGPQWALGGVLALALAAAACGGGVASVPPPAATMGTPAGTYTITIVASAGAVKAQTNFTLTVN